MLHPLTFIRSAICLQNNRFKACVHVYYIIYPCCSIVDIKMYWKSWQAKLWKMNQCIKKNDEKKESRTQVCWYIPLTFSQRLQTTLRGEAAWACMLLPSSRWTCAMWGWIHSQIWKKATYGCIISAFFRWGQCPFKQVIRLGGHLDNALGQLFSSYASAAPICLNEVRPKSQKAVC